MTTKRKPGRPPGSAKYTRRVQIKLDPERYAKAKAEAEADGIDFTEWLRGAIDAYFAKQLCDKCYAELSPLA